MPDPRNPSLPAAPQNSIGIIVLAAGGSSRMSEPKQLLSFRGKTLLRLAVETALETGCAPVVVLLGANFERTRREIEDLPVEIVLNADWKSGLSSSIETGIENLRRLAPGSEAVLLMLADQPFVTAEHLSRFAEKFRQTGAPIIAAEYNRTVGVPALFARAIFDELARLSGDQGAKAVIEKHRAAVHAIELPEAAFDIDTPQDFIDLGE